MRAESTDLTEETRDYDRDSVGSYLRSIGDLPVLGSEETAELCEAMNGHAQRFREGIYGSPDLAAAIVDDWRNRLATGRVTARMSRHHRDGTGTDYSETVDRCLERAEQAPWRDRVGALAKRGVPDPFGRAGHERHAGDQGGDPRRVIELHRTA